MRLFLFFLAAACFSVTARAQIVGGGFKPGYYYDSKGEKHEGYINPRPSSLSRSSKAENAFLFRSGKSSKKHLVYAGEVQSYVTDADSFAVVALPASVHDTRYRVDFAKVLFDEKIKVYLIEEKLSPSFGLSAGNRGAMPSINFSNYRTKIYLYGGSGNSVEVMDKKNYQYILPSVLAAYPDLSEKVKNSQIDYDEIEMLSEEYFNKRSK